MKIVRLEHPKTGEGIFMVDASVSSGAVSEEYQTFAYGTNSWFRRHNKHMRFASAEFPMFKSGEHFCAYNSLEELNNWFEGNELERIVNEFGFQIQELEVSTCHQSIQQSIFLKKDIKWARIVELKELNGNRY